MPKAHLTAERLKREISIRQLVEAQGVKLTPRGADLFGLCPLHHDTQPSLVVSEKKGLWHCLGACKTGGSVIDWVMKTERLSFVKAIQKLTAIHESSMASPTDPSEAVRAPATSAAGARTQQEALALEETVAYYQAKLKERPGALAYLEARGLADPELIEHFRIGYSDRSLERALPARSTTAGAEKRALLSKLGVLRRGEHFVGSIVIPVFDDQGRVLDLYGRRCIDPPGKVSPHRYLPGPHRGVFNLDALRLSEEIVLTEALIDALTFWSAGIRNVTSSYGVEGFGAQHLQAMKAHGTRRVLIAYDGDPAGDRAAELLAKKLKAAGIGSYRVEFPVGMDANAYALSRAPADQSLQALLDRAVPMLGAPARTRELEPAITAPAPLTPAPRIEAVQPSSLAVTRPAPPQLPAPATTVEVRDEEVVFHFADRRYRARGLKKNTSVEVMKLNLLVSRGEHFFVDHLDLYPARSRALFIKQAADELGVKEDVIKSDLGKILFKLESLQEENLRKLLETQPAAVVLSPAEEAAALALLTDPKLLDRILADFERAGVVGERINKLAAYVAAVSRKLDDPLAVIIQSSSAAGKSSLMDAVLAFIPEEDCVKYSAMTGQSLFYMGETDLKHKILAIVEEAGAERAAYALKLLQSEKQLTIASTGKDPETGRLVTQKYKVEGPVMIFLSTTAIRIDDELLNRAIVLTVDEDRAQTQAIHALQRRRETVEGLRERHQREQILKLHQNAQRLLRPLAVTNPFANQLSFIDTKTRTRRDHMKYLVLIRAIALLHQHQRPIRSERVGDATLECIDVTLDDIALANQIAHQVLGRSLDELAPQTRRFLIALDQMLSSLETEESAKRRDVRFTRRQISERAGWTYDQIRIHLERLIELEYVLVHTGRRGQSFSYELLYDGQGQSGGAFVMGLADVAGLEANPKFGGALGAHRGAIGPSLGPAKTEDRACDSKRLMPANGASTPNGHSGMNGRARPTP